ncbi:hypothetical protein M3Y98_00437700 [Aphelenchoides besseyi]|nr:hypothetical protein M3Y98_00437700 [Aphelenchoides besseyi]
MNVRISGTFFLLTLYYQSAISESNFDDYYRAYPIVPMSSANLYYQMVKDERNKNPHNFYNQHTQNIPQSSYWPPSIINTRPADKLAFLNSLQFDVPSVQDQQQTQLQGYGVNAGVYAGLQSSQSGYNYNYNTNPNNRPYGPTNTNVGGSYSGLSPWPFVSTNGENGSVNSSTLPRPQPTQSTTTTEQENRPVAEVSVRTIPIQNLIKSSAKGL